MAKVKIFTTTVVNGRAIHTSPNTGRRLAAGTPVLNLKPKTTRHCLKPVGEKAKKTLKALLAHTKKVQARDRATVAAIKANKEKEEKEKAKGIAPPPTQKEIRATLAARLAKEKKARGTAELAVKAKTKGFKPPSNKRRAHPWVDFTGKLKAHLAPKGAAADYSARLTEARAIYKWAGEDASAFKHVEGILTTFFLI